MSEPCPVEAVQVVVSYVPEAIGKPVVEGFVNIVCFQSDSMNRKKWFPNAALSCAVENSVGLNSSAENKAFGMMGSKTKWPAFAGHGAGGWTGMASVG